MKIVIQVVKEASVSINNEIYNKIDKGYLLLVGIEKDDNEQVVQNIANRICNMRINKDENDKTNLSILDIGGEILSISQFTLAADCSKRRPSFSKAADPVMAKRLYEYFNECLKKLNIVVKEGIFGEYMQVSLINDGPFTIII